MSSMIVTRAYSERSITVAEAACPLTTDVFVLKDIHIVVHDEVFNASSFVDEHP